MVDEEKKVILIVEDDPSVQRLYHDAFSLHGYDVENAGDGEEGIIKAREVKPSVILLDIMMPKLDGISVLKKLKADPDTKGIPVVMLTNIAAGSLGVDEEALEEGAVKYIVKSDHEPDEVVKMVDKVVVGETEKASVSESDSSQSQGN